MQNRSGSRRLARWCGVAAVAATGLTPVAGQAQNITVKGSDTMVLLAQKWAEVYQNQNPGVAIQVTGGGSGTGIAALINGTCNIANSSRDLKGSERKLALSSGVDVQEFAVALDAICVVVNAANPVAELTTEQLMGIYIGAINDWRQVGGTPGPIMRYSRENNSGTYVFMKEHILKNKDYAPDCQTMPGTAAVADAVSKDANGIGYGGVAYFLTRTDCKVLRVKGEAGPAVSPVTADGKSIEYARIYSREYPISRYLFCYTPGAPKGEVKTYLDWILGPAGQQIVKADGYIPLPQQDTK
jgi:phosphate transport system substrate-binding protein